MAGSTIAPVEAAQDTGTEPIRIESYGVRIDLRIDAPELVPKVLSVLPPGWRRATDSFPDAEFSLRAAGEGAYVVSGDGTGRVSQTLEFDLALGFLELHVRSCVAQWAPDHIFVHAGVVVRDGRALLIPGDSFSGKSTMVAALVRAGATYFSDEFAVLDGDGLVHPYPKPLWLRSAGGGPVEQVTAEDLGGTIGEAGAPVGLVAVTSYVPGARWDPQPVARGETALAMLAHTVPAQERPAEALRALRRVAERCTCVRGDRGEAEPIASSLLALLDRS
jgi:hypothetical protein